MLNMETMHYREKKKGGEMISIILKLKDNHN